MLSSFSWCQTLFLNCLLNLYTSYIFLFSFLLCENYALVSVLCFNHNLGFSSDLLDINMAVLASFPEFSMSILC